MGEKAYNWKGGYVNKLKNNRKRRNARLNAEGEHTPKEWEDLKKEYNYKCLCCGKAEPDIRLTEDHIIPLSKGGLHRLSNLQILCPPCNLKKRDKIL